MSVTGLATGPGRQMRILTHPRSPDARSRRGRVLLNAQRAGRMLNEQRQQPFLHPALLHEPSHVVRELIKCRACGSNDKDRLHRTAVASAYYPREICALRPRCVNRHTGDSITVAGMLLRHCRPGRHHRREFE
jgi:hypothetical protein